MNLLIIFIAVLGLCVTSCGVSKPSVEPKTPFTIRRLTNIKFEPNAARLERGRYLSEGVCSVSSATPIAIGPNPARRPSLK